jgi:hypothetical protein
MEVRGRPTPAPHLFQAREKHFLFTFVDIGDEWAHCRGGKLGYTVDFSRRQ